MNENVVKFFELYDSDEALRERVSQAVYEYPGCLEIREAVVEDVLIPIAEDLGLGFTVADLRKYETKKKLSHLGRDEEVTDEELYHPAVYWLMEYGWEEDERVFGKYAEGEK